MIKILKRVALISALALFSASVLANDYDEEYEFKYKYENKYGNKNPVHTKAYVENFIGDFQIDVIDDDEIVNYRSLEIDFKEGQFAHTQGHGNSYISVPLPDSLDYSIYNAYTYENKKPDAKLVLRQYVMISNADQIENMYHYLLINDGKKEYKKIYIKSQDTETLKSPYHTYYNFNNVDDVNFKSINVVVINIIRNYKKLHVSVDKSMVNIISKIDLENQDFSKMIYGYNREHQKLNNIELINKNILLENESVISSVDTELVSLDLAQDESHFNITKNKDVKGDVIIFLNDNKSEGRTWIESESFILTTDSKKINLNGKK